MKSKRTRKTALSSLFVALATIQCVVVVADVVSAAPSAKSKTQDGWATTTVPAKAERKKNALGSRKSNATQNERPLDVRVQVGDRDQLEQREPASSPNNEPSDLRAKVDPAGRSGLGSTEATRISQQPQTTAIEASTTTAETAGRSQEAQATASPIPEEKVLPVDSSASVEKGALKTTSYCLNIANPAIDARYVLQKKRLEDLKSEIQGRTEELEKKIIEFRSWYEKREAFVAKGRDNLVSIYASMKADAAAKQLAEMDEETSSALLARLDPRQSSAVLSEMESKKAARLTEIMSGASSGPVAAAQDTSTPRQEGKSVGSNATPQEMSKP